MKKIGLLSDTHSILPEQVFTHFKDVDEIWHAGDIGTIDLADCIEDFKPLRAVYGNIDGHELRNRYPEYLEFKINDVKFLMMHIGGYPPKYNHQSMELIDSIKPNVFICGHSHILKVMPDAKRNILHINPGACGLQGWHKVCTILKFDVDLDRIRNLEVIEFPRTKG
ncbi:MAG: metallophosphoesterase family protein [Chitinophagaceae bacterium]